ncbi:MAG: nucleotidyltransferase family protein [FCB group bacterium]|jgi:hypothetical protein|nr:nucleotidyltransferase family protein [FCB group bacterium]
MGFLDRGTPEERLVIYAARDEPAAETLQRVHELLQRGVDGDRLVDICRRTKTWTMVLETFRALDGDLPASAQGSLAKLERLKRSVWYPHLLVLSKTRQTVRTLLRERGLPFTFIRGLNFAERYYRHPHNRISGDLDVLLPENVWREAEALFIASGFAQGEPERVAEARRMYMGQVELLHRQSRVSLDLNWRMTGNAGIGDVCVDMDEMWKRAIPAGDSELSLSPADCLWDLVRHVGHGHDFGRGGLIVRACADVNALMRKASDEVDWEYLRYQARKGRFVRIWAFFSHFYDSRYCETGDVRLADCVPEARQRSTAPERELFFGSIIGPRAVAGISNGNARNVFIHTNLALLAKLWGVDTFAGLVGILRGLLWPSEWEWRLLTSSAAPGFGLPQRMRFWADLSMALPGILAGSLMRLAWGILWAPAVLCRPRQKTR